MIAPVHPLRVEKRERIDQSLVSTDRLEDELLVSNHALWRRPGAVALVLGGWIVVNEELPLEPVQLLSNVLPREGPVQRHTGSSVWNPSERTVEGDRRRID